MTKPAAKVTPNTWEFLRDPMITPTGFREYDARWKYPEEINLPGMTALGLGLGTQMIRRGIAPVIAVGNDYRDYSLTIKNALILGLMRAGITVKDIGPCITPMAYFSSFHLGGCAVAMVTASHNPNGWTGVKMGFNMPLTHGPDEMGELKEIVLNGDWETREGGKYEFVDGVWDAYMDDLVGDFKMSRKLKVVCATGNGTACAYAPALFERIGVEVVESHNTLDYTFPNYNPNPEAMEMLHDMAHSVKASGADFALGFDGDGDRCGVVDDEGEEIFADKVGVMLARDISALHPNSQFVVDVKSTGLFNTDPVLKANGAKTDYFKTGHSYIKRRVTELGAIVGFEKSGHYFFNAPIGRGYDDGLVSAIAVLDMLDRNPDKTMADLRRDLPKTWGSPTMSPHCDDELKYGVVDKVVDAYKALGAEGGEILGRKVVDVNTVNGARVTLDDGSWVLVRASSNKPELVVVVESMQSDDDMRSLFREEVKPRLAAFDEVGAYNQEI